MAAVPHPSRPPRTRAGSRSAASSPRATRTSSPSRASRRTGPSTLLCFEPAPRRSRRGRRRLTSTARSTRCSRTGASGVRRWRSPTHPTPSRRAFAARPARRGARRRPARGPARRRGVRAHRRPLAANRTATKKARGEPRALLEIADEAAISSSRCACASCDDASRRRGLLLAAFGDASWPEPSSRPASSRPCGASWPEPSWPLLAPCGASSPGGLLGGLAALLRRGLLLRGLALGCLALGRAPSSRPCALGGSLLGSPFLRCLLSRRHGHHLSVRALTRGSSNFIRHSAREGVQPRALPGYDP